MQEYNDIKAELTKVNESQSVAQVRFFFYRNICAPPILEMEVTKITLTKSLLDEIKTDQPIDFKAEAYNLC